MRNLVEPIKSKKDIVLIENDLSKHNIRNQLIWVFGTNTGLRISDVLGLNVEDVRNRYYVEIIEKKTKKYKRFADIYFALLHELAHCKSDFNRAKNGSIISSIDDISTDEYEKKADLTALNWMVDNKYYNLIKNKPSDINSFDVIKSFYVYRLAHDNIINYSSKLYQNNNKLIGDL